MGGLFGGGGDGGASAQLEQQKKQVAKQEADLAKKESNLAVQAQAGVKARRGGGMRALLSAERPDELGIQPTKLGGGS